MSALHRIQARGRRGASEAAVVVSVARGVDAFVEAFAITGILQNAPTAALVDDPRGEINVMEHGLVVIHNGHQVNYLVAHDGRAGLADVLVALRQRLAQRQVLVEPPEGLHRVNDSLLV